MRLGCIADDFTGASDVAAALRLAGLRTTLAFGVPGADVRAPAADAVVIGAKIRTAPVDTAVEQAVRAVGWLRDAGARRVYFKHCSTFDSTDRGNIGPIADALVEAMAAPIAVVCPAAPLHGRTVYQGHLFVGTQLLSETSMRDHPLTPMRDPNVVRLLRRQTEATVELVPHEHVRAGVDAVAAELGRLRRLGVRYAVVDALTEEDLRTIAGGCAGLPLVAGAAGLAPHLEPTAERASEAPRPPAGRAAVLAGSCSDATLAQVERARGVLPSYRVDPRSGGDQVAAVARWLDDHASHHALMVYASAPRQERAPGAADEVERVLSAAAGHVVAGGVRRLVVAGGETSAAVVGAIGVTTCRVGAEESPGVPWLFPDDDRDLALLLKSGNFGDPDLLVRSCLGGRP